MTADMTAAIEAVLQALTAEVKAVRLFQEHSARGPMAPEDDVRDPRIFFVPKTWKGSLAFKGLVMSQCSPEFLDVYSSALRYLALIQKDEEQRYNGKLKWRFTAADAARANRWAWRLRLGWQWADKPVPKPFSQPTANPFATPTRTSSVEGQEDVAFSLARDIRHENAFDEDAPLQPATKETTNGDFDDERDEWQLR
jgi:hypothetical protein